jgi:translation initiation factor IF-3
VHYASVFYAEGVIIIVPNNNQKKPNKQQSELINESVRFPSVRLIGPNGEQLGVMSSREAQLKANEYELDLVCVSPKAEPPVCKLLNYGKYRFEQQ